ncbi:MAG: OmpA family protein [Calditrichota bacterium]
MKPVLFHKVLCGLLAALLWATVGFAQTAVDDANVGSRELMLRAERALNVARMDQVDILAPTNFGKAQKAYDDAKNYSLRGKPEDQTAAKLREAMQLLLAAEETARSVELNVPLLLEARAAALSTGADTLSGDSWKKAEQRFSTIITNIERDKPDLARKDENDAAALYKVARRDALRSQVLGETRGLINEAQKRKGDKLTPTLLLRAEQAAGRAEAALAEDDLETAQREAQTAGAHARHALAMIDQIEKVQNRKDGWEAAMLVYDDLLAGLADSLGGKLNFARGGWAAGSQILALIRQQTDSITAAELELQENFARTRQSLESSLSEATNKLVDAQDRIAELEKRIGVVESQRTAAREELEKKAASQEKIKHAQELFEPGVATVLSDPEGHVIIRLYGLKFGVGQSKLDRNQRKLINTASEAINLFPGAAITVEGHTDNQGGEDINQELSEERAQSVADYLQSQLGMAEDRIQVAGYGESKPIATNDTAQGRAQNRRIDIVLTLP